MRGDREVGSERNAGKDVILRFAPNFTAYVLPPDTVCLYSEDRKFFLHGELYCALASAVGQGGKSFRALVGELERNFPRDKIEEAFKRLLDRRFVVAQARTLTDVAAAYWASIGLLPQSAEQNLKSCRVRIVSLDVDGDAQIARALSRLGVRVTRGSADLTVTLISDYLDGQLAELNR